MTMHLLCRAARKLLPYSALLLLVPANLLAQTSSVTASDPNAVALAGKALQALAGGTALTDVTIQATANYIAGSDQETGTATLVALGNQQSLVTLRLSGGLRQEIRDATSGAWLGPDGVPHAMAVHNCWVDAPWFYPGLILAALATDQTLTVSSMGQEVHAGRPAYHLVVSHIITGQARAVAASIQQLSAMDLYLDLRSLLPVALAFNVHANDDAEVTLPEEIRFDAYQTFHGVQAPTRIQKYLQGSLTLDINATSVVVNSGVSASLFTLPSVYTGGNNETF